MVAAIGILMHDATPMKNLMGLSKIETHEIVVSLLFGHSKDGVMQHSPVLSRPRSKDALGIMRIVGDPPRCLHLRFFLNTTRYNI